jgi:hypothetical protein
MAKFKQLTALLAMGNKPLLARGLMAKFKQLSALLVMVSKPLLAQGLMAKHSKRLGQFITKLACWFSPGN